MFLSNSPLTQVFPLLLKCLKLKRYSLYNKRSFKSAAACSFLAWPSLTLHTVYQQQCCLWAPPQTIQGLINTLQMYFFGTFSSLFTPLTYSNVHFCTYQKWKTLVMYHKDVNCSHMNWSAYFYRKLVQNNINEVTALIDYSNKECIWFFGLAISKCGAIQFLFLGPFFPLLATSTSLQPVRFDRTWLHFSYIIV